MTGRGAPFHLAVSGAGRVWDHDRMTDVPIEDDMIRLGQFLKLAGVGDTGADAKALIADGEVAVNGEVDLRRARQLHRGDVVAVLGQEFRVA